MRFTTILCTIALLGLVACGKGSAATTPDPVPLELEPPVPSQTALITSTPAPTPAQSPTPIPSSPFKSAPSPTRMPSQTPVPTRPPVTYGSPEWQNCLRQALGEAVFNTLAQGARPSQDELNLMRPCRRFNLGGGENRGRPPADLTPIPPPPVPTPSVETSLYQGFWEPGLKGSIAGELEHLKGLGVNTMSVVPSYRPLPDGTFSTRPDNKQIVIAQIVEAHENGIQVYLVPTFWNPSAFPDRSKAWTYLENSSGPHHQDSGEAKIRESTAGVSRKPSSDCKACRCSSKHLCGLTAWNT